MTTKSTTIKDRATTALNLDYLKNECTFEKVSPLKIDIPDKDIMILRMLINCPNGDWVIPDEYQWLSKFLSVSVDHLERVLGIYQPYCYLTIRSQLEYYENTENDWHLDGVSFRYTQLPQQNYLWTNVYGTEYTTQPYDIDHDFDPKVYNVNEYLSKRIDESKIQMTDTETIYCIDPYILHRKPRNQSDLKGRRTFLRLSFIPLPVNDVNNTPNPLDIRVDRCGNGVEFRNKLEIYDR